jgi:hypothetical protein
MVQFLTMRPFQIFLAKLVQILIKFFDLASSEHAPFNCTRLVVKRACVGVRYLLPVAAVVNGGRSREPRFRRGSPAPREFQAISFFSQ